MNDQEQRALQAIEQNLAVEDPKSAELLRTCGKSRWIRIGRYAAVIAREAEYSAKQSCRSMPWVAMTEL